MTESIEWLRIFIINYPSLQYLVIFLGAAFGGELVMIAFGFMAAQGLFSFYPFILISFLGTFSSDVLWFMLAKTSLANRFFSHRYTNGTVLLINEAVRRVSKGNNFVVLLLANFMLASRIILIMFVSKSEFSFMRFIVYEAIAVSLWLASVIAIGFASGLGFTYLAGIFQNIYAGLGFLLLIFLVIIVVQTWLKKRFTRTPKLGVTPEGGGFTKTPEL